MAVARSQHDLQHMDAVLDEIQMLHERITQLEFGYKDLMDAAKKAASGAYSAAGKAASAAVKKGSEMVHGSKKAPVNTDDDKNEELQQFEEKIHNMVYYPITFKRERDDAEQHWTFTISKLYRITLYELQQTLNPLYPDLKYEDTTPDYIITVPFSSIPKHMKSDITAYSRAVLRQVDSRAAVPRQMPTYDW